eukprot:TRINITY_DN1854_c0_g5_i1.p3 TRINITY_DN1854_c0_g5~~TRINITY_DN1854_c0_g5_i1.p3  ORF type:complete len:103 (-),score=10.09 TRINITY_DN1854_c0_g5_i1:173-481(-)
MKKEASDSDDPGPWSFAGSLFMDVSHSCLRGTGHDGHGMRCGTDFAWLRSISRRRSSRSGPGSSIANLVEHRLANLLYGFDRLGRLQLLCVNGLTVNVVTIN